jgi:prophage regulatory protein
MQERRLIKIKEVTKIVGMGRTTVYDKMKEGTFPKPIFIGDRMARWDSIAVNEWIKKTIDKSYSVKRSLPLTDYLNRKKENSKLNGEI